MSLKITCGVANMTITYHAERALAKARGYFDAGDLDHAVIAAQTASELAVRRALTAIYGRRGIGDLDGALNRLLGKSNITNPKVQAYFAALSGDRATQKPFWNALLASAEKRNAIVHRGEVATEADAQNAILANEQAIDWLITHIDPSRSTAPA
ncbi:MAG TPA: hypothetical protein VGR35_00345 [Tepidisphaeraceae bacterium]|nr:hypothetical protein [Tepidisphaeraceae bacterium]